MSLYTIEDYNLTQIADAIRRGNGTDNKYTPSQMPNAIKQLTMINLENGDIPTTGDLSYLLAGPIVGSMADNTYIEFTNITDATGMYYKSTIKDLPHYFNGTGKDGTSICCAYMFAECKDLKWIRSFYKAKFNDCYKMFYNCHNLRQGFNLTSTDINTGKQYADFASGEKNQHAHPFPTDDNDWLYRGTCASMFENCYSLGYLGDMKYIMCNTIGNSSMERNGFYCYTFKNCFCVDDIKNFHVNTTDEITTNQFLETFKNCFRLGEFTFETNADGTPLTAKWANQKIDLSSCGYYTSNSSLESNIGGHPILGFSWSGLSGTGPKECNSLATWNSYRDSGWGWSSSKEYGRFTYSNMMDTIASLPDTSEFVAEREAEVANGQQINVIYFPEQVYYDDGTPIDWDSIDYFEFANQAVDKGWMVYTI